MVVSWVGGSMIWKTLMIDGETWDSYEVSDLGEIRSIDRYIGNRFWPGKVISPHLCNGYHRVQISQNDRAKKVNVHRAVLDTFMPRSGDKLLVRHKDDDRTNNKLSNLEWGTYQENSRDQVESKAKYVKLDAQQVDEIRNLYAQGGTSYKELAIQFGISTTQISRIVKRKAWGFR